MLRAVRFQAAARVPVPALAEPPAGSLPEAAACLVFRQGTGLGYWLYPPFDADVTWRGGTDFHVECADELGQRLWVAVQEELTGWPSRWWCSKLNGVFQMDPGLVFVTPPGTKLLLTAPINRPTRHFWVQTGVLDSEWFHVPSAINIEPFEPGTTFALRRDVPIAQIVVLDDATSRRPALETSEIEHEPRIMELWRGYIHDKFRDTQGAADGAQATRGTYARWKGDVERRSKCPVTRAREVLSSVIPSRARAR